MEMEQNKNRMISSQIMEKIDTLIKEICRKETKLLTQINHYVSVQEHAMHDDNQQSVITGENMNLIKQYLHCLQIGLVSSSEKQISNENNSLTKKEVEHIYDEIDDNFLENIRNQTVVDCTDAENSNFPNISPAISTQSANVGSVQDDDKEIQQEACLPENSSSTVSIMICESPNADSVGNSELEYGPCPCPQTLDHSVGGHEEEMEIHNQTKSHDVAEEDISSNTNPLLNSGIETANTAENISAGKNVSKTVEFVHNGSTDKKEEDISSNTNLLLNPGIETMFSARNNASKTVEEESVHKESTEKKEEDISSNTNLLLNPGIETMFSVGNNASKTVEEESVHKESTDKNEVIETFQTLDRNTALDWTNVLHFSIKQLARNIISEYNRVLEMIEKDKDKLETVSKTKQHLERRSKLIEDAKKVLNFMQVNTFLLIGCSGNGKSATGNSILREPCFETTSSTTSIESSWVYKSRNFNGTKIGVIDGPGVDTNSSNDDILKTATESLKKALQLCNYNFTALLIVLKYGSRYTKQEGLTIKLLKGLLGENIIADSGICVFTHGDTFDDDQKFQDSPVSFGEWCMEQEGEIKKLFEECRDRIAIFNNKEHQEKKKTFQVEKLFQLTGQVKSFSKDDFESSKEERELFEQENLNIEIKRKIEQRLSEIRSKLRSLESTPNCDVIEMLKNLQILERQLDDCLAETPSSSKNVRSLVLALVLEIQSKKKLIEFDKQNGSTGSTSKLDNAKSPHTESYSQKQKNKLRSKVSKIKKRVFKK